MIEIIHKEFERRIIEEGLTRIKYCASQLSEKELWYQDNENTNSVGNLIMHLEGNVRQYITSGIGGKRDTRTRDAEFDPKNIKTKELILLELEKTLNESAGVINNLNQKNLTESRTVQGFEETVLSIIIHVIEHFSYHVGQITYMVKSRKNIDTGYYAGLDLNITD